MQKKRQGQRPIFLITAARLKTQQQPEAAKALNSSKEPFILQKLKDANHQLLIICLATASDQLNREANVDVFGYLVKPFSLERFLDITNSAREFLSTSNASLPVKSRDFIFVKSEYKIIKVMFADILFCEGMKDYTQIYLKGKTDPILTLNNLKLFSSKLPADGFIRVHRSYIVAISHIDSITRNEIYVGKKIIPIGDSYKDEFYRLIESNS